MRVVCCDVHLGCRHLSCAGAIYKAYRRLIVSSYGSIRPLLSSRGGRGLQLHILSALGGIWRESRAVDEELRSDTVSLSVVMKAGGAPEASLGGESRRLVEERGELRRDTELAMQPAE